MQVLVVQVPPVIWYGPQTGLGFVFTIGVSPRTRGVEVGSGMRGRRREPLAPWHRAKAFRAYRYLALQPVQNVGGLGVLGTLDVRTKLANACLELRFERAGVVVAVELPVPWRSGRASYDSPRGFHERAKRVPVDTFSRHTSGAIREME